MKIIQYLFIRVFFVFAFLLGANELYKWFLWESDLLENSSDLLLDLKKAEKEADILYLAESSNFTIDTSDFDQRTISGMADDALPDLKIVAVERGAIHAGTYLELLKQIDPVNRKVSTVVVTLNLRSFNATWINSELESLLRKQEVMYYDYPPLFNRFLLAFGGYDNKSVEDRQRLMLEEWKTKELVFPFEFKYKTVREWDEAMANGTYLKKNGEWDLDKIGLACSYVKTYAFNLSDDNPRIRDFDEIVEVCKEKNLNLCFNLMAENLDYAERLVGKELVWLIRQNRDFLVKRYSGKGVHVIDNLEKVKAVDFINQDWTTEHYTEHGRKAIAKSLSEQLLKLYPAVTYIPLTISNDVPTTNVYSCDMDSISPLWRVKKVSEDLTGETNKQAVLNDKYGVKLYIRLAPFIGKKLKADVEYNIISGDVTDHILRFKIHSLTCVERDSIILKSDSLKQSDHIVKTSIIFPEITEFTNHVEFFLGVVNERMSKVDDVKISLIEIKE